MYSLLLKITEAQKRKNAELEAKGKKWLADRKLAAAGVKKKVAKRELLHSYYKATLTTHRDRIVTQKTLRSYNHTVSNITQHRIGLTAYDDKRYMLDDGITTRAYGHFRDRKVTND